MKKGIGWIVLDVCLLVLPFISYGQNSTFVDGSGLIRWTRDESEVYGFGVNYTVPFAHAYRMAERMGVDPEMAISQDVYHMARLGLDLYRVHVWDTEITDTLGNLLSNEHLRLFDFTISQMKARGMKFVITPIAYWGNGWPEPDSPTPGFSYKYGKEGCLVVPEAIKAQENYLTQFMNHVNPYTGVAYKDEPALVVVEVCNEPHHSGTVTETQSFINRMVAAIRRSGATVPVFYNMSHSIHLVDAYLNSDAQGGTFQWYPANLVANHGLKGNFLPHVASYDIPFAGDKRFMNKAKIVYEFDAADVWGNYMYPAMAQSFRAAGMQLATQFEYDAMFLAPYNTNYGTHFMNLAYAPQKALSLKIASAVFHHQPLHSRDDHSLRISYQDNLTEYNTSSVFYYSNNTSSTPVSEKELKEVAGWGCSPVVKYDGTGAYFLDEIEKGIWRLEVMPDVYWIDDPYSSVSPRKQVSAVYHARRNITVNLSALGSDFLVRGLNAGNQFIGVAKSGHFTVTPGTYLLVADGKVSDVSADTPFRNIRMGEFVAPESNLATTRVRNLTPESFPLNESPLIRFEVMTPGQPLKSEVIVVGNSGKERIAAQCVRQNVYEAQLPEKLWQSGWIRYNILVKDKDSVIFTFPSGFTGDPFSWDNYDHTAYSISVLPSSSPVMLWSAGADWAMTMHEWLPGVKLMPTFNTSVSQLLLDFGVTSPYRRSDVTAYGFKFYFKDKIGGWQNELLGKKELVIRGRNMSSQVVDIEVGIQDEAGRLLKADVLFRPEMQEIRIPTQALEIGQPAIIPRPYPDFLPYYSAFTAPGGFSWNQSEILQIVIKPHVADRNLNNVTLMLESVRLE